MEVNFLLKEFGVRSTNELLLNKQKAKQTRIFSVKKPAPVAMSADECRKLCDKIGVNYAPGYESRVLQYIVSNETVDRYGDIVRAKGVQFENYMKNPVMFFSHQYTTPIGNSLKVWHEKASKNIQAWGLFIDDNVDKSGISDLTFRLASSGFMKACSIGFMPLEANVPKTAEEAERMGLGKYGVEYLKTDMLEWSPCGVPANPEALQNALKSLGNALDIRKEDIALAKQFNLFDDDNMLDMFEQLSIVRSSPALGIPSKDFLNNLDNMGAIIDGKKIIPFKSYPLADEDASWDGPAEIRAADVDDLKIMCTWYDAENADAKSAYKLPHHTKSEYKTVWKGVAAAMAALLGARGGVDIPDDDKKGVYNHLAKHYKEFDKEVPEFKSYTDDELAKMFDPHPMELLEQERAALIRDFIESQKLTPLSVSKIEQPTIVVNVNMDETIKIITNLLTEARGLTQELKTIQKELKDAQTAAHVPLLPKESLYGIDGPLLKKQSIKINLNEGV